MDDLFSDALERLFEQMSTPAVIRQVEHDGNAKALWAGIEASGFLDALVPEQHGGAGLTLAQAFPLFMSAGRHAVPVPFAQTMLARAYLAQVGAAAPAGAIALLGHLDAPETDAPLRAFVPFGRTADWVLARVDGRVRLLPVEDRFRLDGAGYGGLGSDIQWTGGWDGAAQVPDAGCDIDSLAAASYSAQIAGAADRVLALTLDYANQRTQFGKPIGKFQAVQNQISIMAERVWVSRMAAQLACQSDDWRPQALMAAAGKARTSEAAAIVADISHAVHGAIGITEEYDLQLYTRKLREWRHAGGSETYWESRLGGELLRQDDTALSFMCGTLSP
ncbi:acyl-CoA dehydrogenase [Pusillimonas sp. SM2304]|uniref:acyl-CoA dehydrogenase n=1 Tax=Pusillimonas sp. SM2304 TaxID=3073241 RepID=UPI002875DB39|nr:acyl-CoA dehydrogenase [Pusillimonas sp. SM2304]MDS1139126.1 acyl-CoA dehydrogenase [Pusillimonas sp. SM2304]